MFERNRYKLKGMEVAQTWDPGSVAYGVSTTTTATVAGAELGDFAIASFSLDAQQLALSAYVSAANTATVVLANVRADMQSINLSSGTLRVRVEKKGS